MVFEFSIFLYLFVRCAFYWIGFRSFLILVVSIVSVFGFLG